MTQQRNEGPGTELPEMGWAKARSVLTESEFPELVGFDFDLASHVLHAPYADESFTRLQGLRFEDVHPEFAASEEQAIRDAKEDLKLHPEGEKEAEENKGLRQKFADGLRSWLERNRGAAAVAAGAAEGVVRARFGWLTALLRQGGTAAEAAATRVRGELASRKLNAADKQVIYEALAGFFGGAGVGVAGTAAAVAMGIEPFSAQMLKATVGMTFMFGSLIALDSSREARLMEKSGEMSLLEGKHPRIAGLARWLASEKISHVAVFTGAVGGGLMIESMGESVLRALQIRMEWQQAVSAHGQQTPQPETATEQPPSTPQPPTSTPGPEATATPHPGEDGGAHGGGGTGTETGSGTETGTGTAGGETGEYPDQGEGAGWEWGSADEVAQAQAAGDAARAVQQAASAAQTPAEILGRELATGTVWGNELAFVKSLGSIDHVTPVTNALKNLAAAFGDSDKWRQIGPETVVKITDRGLATWAASQLDNAFGTDKSLLTTAQRLLYDIGVLGYHATPAELARVAEEYASTLVH